MRQLLLTAVTCSLLAAQTLASSVLLLDGSARRYIAAGSRAVTFTEEGVHSTLAALARLEPAHPVDVSVAEQVEEVLKANPLKTPKAVFIANVAGVSSDSDVSTLLEGREHRSVQFSAAEGEQASLAMLRAVATLAHHNPDVPSRVLDHDVLKGCNDECLAGHLRALAPLIGADAQQLPNGRLSLAGTGGVVLDLGKKADRLLAVELASLYAGVSSHVADVSARQPGTGELDLLEAPLLGVQAVANARRGGGAASAHAVAAARSAVEKLLSWAVGQLDAAYSGDVVFQVSLLGDLPASGVQSLVNFKEGGRRVLLQDVDPEHLKTQAFSAKAAAYGAFVLILYFVLGVIYCMTFGMTFPVDTLLFGSGKQD